MDLSARGAVVASILDVFRGEKDIVLFGRFVLDCLFTGRSIFLLGKKKSTGHGRKNRKN